MPSNLSEPPSLPHPSLAENDVTDILRLIRSENVGPVGFFNLVSFYGSVKAAMEAVPELMKRRKRKRPIVLADSEAVEEELEAALALGVRLIPYGHADYPPLLAHIHDAPPLLMVRGKPEVWQGAASVGVVGARNASGNGCRLTYRLAKDLAEADKVVTSGLARGVDTHAHRGALEMEGRTVAVVAGGVDIVYPPENQGLYEQLIEQGAVVSEAPLSTSPQARHFPRRNRIISGMSQGVLVIEAAKKSGSLITARFALEQGREVFAIPGSPMDPRSGGTNALLKDGAVLTESAEDILNNLPESPRFEPHKATQPSLFREASEEAFAHEELAACHVGDETPQEAEAQLEALLSTTPISADELAEHTGLPIHQIHVLLMQKELSGALERYAGGLVSARMG